jgi:hypothetical protein
VFVIWVWSLIATGMFWLLEHAAVPAFFALVGMHPRYRKARRRRRLAARQAAAQLALRGVRARLRGISERYDPDRALPPGEDDRR